MPLFGWATLGKVKYGDEVLDKDFIVSTFGEIFPRQDEDEHLITEKELERSIDDKTKVFVIGTGEYGIVKISKDARSYCKRNKIKLIARKTQEAIKAYNKLMKRKGRKPGVTAIIHVSC
ncbi:MAG: hypothetical protein J7L23_01675 [Candidatus Diapherotrites archaeon]|nr:hypothetical protein [Candidatus Diapherotrites archaeon]